MKKRGFGLRIKFAFLVTSLVLVIVLIVSIPLGLFMIQTQQRTLAEGLDQSTRVLLESLTTGAAQPLRSGEVFLLQGLLKQTTALEDSLYATIAAFGTDDEDNFDYTWVSNDPDISGKVVIDGNLEFDLNRNHGIYYMDDRISGQIQELINSVTERAEELVGEKRVIYEDYVESTAEERIQLREKEFLGDTEAEAQRIAIDDEGTRQRLLISSALEDLDIIESVPSFNTDALSLTEKDYVFYKPIIYFDEGDNYYYRGVVRLGISTERILNEISDARRSLITRTAIIAAIAIVFGIFSALLLATIIIIPIKQLLKGVELIRDTEDKEDLDEHIIKVNTKDEISVLADTVNQMTKGLVKAAAANKMLTAGKEVQKMFLPLEKDNEGSKLSVAESETKNASFFGYYEGAKGVSGDYFDFQKLDDKYYAIIKCDVAGKGIPAALIMVEVATIFLNHFKKWNPQKPHLSVQELVFSINDLVEERGFKGRFAALIVILYNSETGGCYMCNAGDNLVYIYDNAANKVVTKTLPEAPATGVFPNMMLEIKGGYQQVHHKLKKGDIIFLATDGIEESQRFVRDESFMMIKSEQDTKEDGLVDGKFKVNRFTTGDTEEFGLERFHEIINHIMGKKEFAFERYFNPIGDEDLRFDFSKCSDSLEDAVLAIIAVEQIFRIIPDFTDSKDYKIQIDKKVDGFLKKYFNKYDIYFANPIPEMEDSMYVYFYGLREDDQYDDLTILSIRQN